MSSPIVTKKKRRSTGSQIVEMKSLGTEFTQSIDLPKSRKSRSGRGSDKKKKHKKEKEKKKKEKKDKRKGKRRGTGDKQENSVEEGEVSRMNGVLYVEVVEGELLGEGFVKKGVYVVASATFGKQRFKSKVLKKTSGPQWEKECQFFSDSISGSELLLNLFISERHKNELVGVGTVDLTSLECDVDHDIWLEMVPVSRKLINPYESRVRVKIYYKNSESSEDVNTTKFEDQYELGKQIGSFFVNSSHISVVGFPKFIPAHIKIQVKNLR
eukprot:TRINITY_DN1472_c0_g1_i2.p1 TRINITY_DN1472_c0_g1~~TRINITY_DN1472_c0_g1_i2.p1  ORF type:complete len:276 (+),score=64.33 TRINITY_DN1472_c0_g1_i2:24-830(+)